MYLCNRKSVATTKCGIVGMWNVGWNIKISAAPAHFNGSFRNGPHYKSRMKPKVDDERCKRISRNISRSLNEEDGSRCVRFSLEGTGRLLDDDADDKNADLTKQRIMSVTPGFLSHIALLPSKFLITKWFRQRPGALLSRGLFHSSPATSVRPRRLHFTGETGIFILQLFVG